MENLYKAYVDELDDKFKSHDRYERKFNHSLTHFYETLQNPNEYGPSQVSMLIQTFHSAPSPPLEREILEVGAGLHNALPRMHGNSDVDREVVQSGKLLIEIPTYSGLTQTERLVLGENGQAVYEKLDTRQKVIFCTLMSVAEFLGAPIEQLRIQKIDPERIYFTPASEPAFRLWFDDLVKRGVLSKKSPWKIFHRFFHFGMNSWGGRSRERGEYSLQFGGGSQGAFIDGDRFNPDLGIRDMLKHALLEALPNHLLRHKTDPYLLAQYFQDRGVRMNFQIFKFNPKNVRMGEGGLK